MLKSNDDEEVPSPILSNEPKSYDSTSQKGLKEDPNDEDIEQDAPTDALVAPAAPPPENQEYYLNLWEIACLLSTAFSYGCIMTTLFIITLPVECARIYAEFPSLPSSICLGIFVAIAGVTQLTSPFIGMLSDMYRPPTDDIGQRMPYHGFGSILTILGLIGELIASSQSFWLRYGMSFFSTMIGLNITYSMMLAMIPDQVPRHQTGVANSVLAFLVVTGSLAGFGLFESILSESVYSMYMLYIAFATLSAILTGLYANERDVQVSNARKRAGLLQSRAPLVEGEEETRKRVGPWILFRSMLIDPIKYMDWATLGKSYTIDRTKYHDFFIVTVARLFYYCGMSVETFFLYYLIDVIGIDSTTADSSVAVLAILAQALGALTCYPTGLLSDHCLNGRRRPFVYLACAILSICTASFTFARTFTAMEIICLCLGTGNGIYLTMETSLAVDVLPHDLEGERSEGNAQLLGVWGVAAFLGACLGPMIGGPLLYLFGGVWFPPATGSTATYGVAGYDVVFAMSALYFICSGITLLFIRHPNI